MLRVAFLCPTDLILQQKSFSNNIYYHCCEICFVVYIIISTILISPHSSALYNNICKSAIRDMQLNENCQSKRRNRNAIRFCYLCFNWLGVAADRLSILSDGAYSTDLSVQQMLSCSNFVSSSVACEGGRLEDAWWWLKKQG